ncbi:uncharacterized protein LOC135368645 [Ornithodoros turicata]|uniref:uncharacterized protein LOC135368645 n=1 Tax=Ornithodoros turicata TaxID=34597 RepID=UPI003139B2B0
MGNYMHLGSNSYKFSECSKSGMRETLEKRLQEDIQFKRDNPLQNSDESDERGCFGNAYEAPLEILDKDLPGTNVDRNVFCRAVMPFADKANIHICDDWFKNTKEWETEECVTRCCYGWAWTLYEQIPYKSLDGFKCYMSKKVCYAGECVDPGTDINTHR